MSSSTEATSEATELKVVLYKGGENKMNGLNNRKAALKLVWVSQDCQSEEKKDNVVAFIHYVAVIHGGKDNKRTWHRHQESTVDVA